jgi:hypothetical protein
LILKHKAKLKLSLFAVAMTVTLVVAIGSHSKNLATVADGPGTSQNDCFPCKILTNYKASLQIRQCIGVVGLQFSIRRTDSSILTTIWSSHSRSSLLVDWSNGTIAQSDVDHGKSGQTIVPQYVSREMVVAGGNGKIQLILDGKATNLPWTNGLIAYPLISMPESPVAICQVRRDSPAEGNPLQGLVCLSASPFKVLGEIKTPPSSTALWCLYGDKQQVLLIIEHDWNWIAMVDLSKSKINR